MNKDNTKKKILFFHHSDSIGGAGISGLNFVNAINKQEYDVYIYCYSMSDKMADIFKENNYSVIYSGDSPISFNHCVGSETFILSPRFVKNILKIHFDKVKISRIIEQYKPDIVIVNSMTLFWINVIAKRYGSQTICIYRETKIHGLIGFRTRHIEFQLGKYTDKISFISYFDLARIKKNKSKKYLIYNSLNENKYLDIDKDKVRCLLNLKNDFQYVLFVGGFSKLKGALILLKAIKLVEKKDVKFLIVGFSWNGKRKKLSDCRTVFAKLRFVLNSDYESKCIDFILKNDLEDKIIFFDSQKDISLFYKASDLLVFPTVKPHQARPLIEAAYAKIPSIVTNFQNYNEFGDNCIFKFRNKDYHELSKLIVRVLSLSISESLIDSYYNLFRERHNEEKFRIKIANLLGNKNEED